MRNENLNQWQWVFAAVNALLALGLVIGMYYRIQAFPELMEATIDPLWGLFGGLWGFTVSRGLVLTLISEVWDDMIWYLQAAALFFVPVFVILQPI